jgi:hemerythrin-like metal-binding protein
MKNVLYIVWQSSNETGIPIIDEQHRGILSTINSLYYFLQHGDAQVAFEPTMDVLHQYTKLHFMTEEALMREAGYRAIDEHIILHKQFMDHIRIMAKSRADPDQVVDLLKFLKEWWQRHINREDRDYVPTVLKNLRVR